MKWKLKAIGGSGGYAKIGETVYHLKSCDEIILENSCLPDQIELVSRKGKFADSEDSFLYLFCEIDPAKENIDISADFSVLKSEMIPDYQTGYGILAADTAFSGANENNGGRCRHRNQLMTGRFRTIYGQNHGYGIRVISGYTSPDASEYTQVRKLDPTRVFSCQEAEDKIIFGDTCRLRLVKNNQGFHACITKNAVTDTLEFPGCDFLLRQNSKTIAFGFAAAGKIRISLSGIQVFISEGTVSKTPEDAIQNNIPDYPFSRNMFTDVPLMNKELKKDTVLYVSADGKGDASGTKDDPLDIYTAFDEAAAGTEIVLLDGTYHLQEPLYLSSFSGGTFSNRMKIHAENTRRVIFDGSSLKKKTPLMILRGSYFRIEGIVFRNSPLSGLMICGNGNIILNCEACHNRDTGILLCAYPGEERNNWPSYNQIDCCDSYDNCDPVLCNADGFGAKLKVGTGNGFYRCIAHHNIDDGFDLYTKSSLGPIEPVLIEQCIAYENGKTLNDKYIRPNHSGGIGFKLGGENQPVPHELWDCIAFLNNQHGISSNSNPSVHLHYCTAFDNGRKKGKDDFVFSGSTDSRQPSFIKEGLLPSSVTGNRDRGWSLILRAYRRIAENRIRPLRRDDGTINYRDFAGIRKPGNRGAMTDPDRKRTVMMMISSLGGGGAERVTSILASELSEKYNVYILCTGNYKKNTYKISSNVHVMDVTWANGTFLSRKFGIAIRWPFRLWSILQAKRKYHPDATVSMLHKPNLYNSYIKWGDRRIMSERNDPSRKSAEEFADAKRSYAKADHVVFQSERVKGLFSKEIQSKSTIIRNPISVSCFADQHPRHKIVTVGRFVPQKNHELLIRAFNDFVKAHPAYTLHLYGDGPLRRQLEDQVRELGIEEHVFLEDFKTNIHEEIRDAEIFVLSSDYEGMSNSLMEAMMMGIPCISTACTGSDELLEDGVNGLLTPVGDAEALAAALSRLADDKKLCGMLRIHAQLQSLGFEKEKVIRAWERIMFR